MRRMLLRALGFGILVSSLIVVIWFGESAARYFVIGDCIGELPSGIEVVGISECVATCPVFGPDDPGRCTYWGDDYELVWGQVANYENTGELMIRWYLDWTCEYLVNDSCELIDCPQTVLYESYYCQFYNDIEPDPNCP